ncbi:iron ABC transporter permease [Marinobacter salarius]|jgi:iron complex transport system permease protein|uniref:FecCD family ABC transporter permease n=2 Tax=Marinobacteraceae TaxID=2887365 RepID=UPI001D19870C|nr:iron ABC transporter permease [Marinobacter salarius]MCC4284158.1 iron ABC transporter permease [Marinobacter salarius]|tara:strand:- start:7767 stop:8714 length:948 start_codon:yes stop_codon:yes gene_type:complete
MAIISLASLVLGAGPVAPGDALAVLVGEGSEEARFVLMELRLPRLAVGVTTGLALGVAGALLQAMTRNPLAEPGLLGVSAGSAFAVSLAILLGASTVTLTTLVAQAGALGGCSLVIAASRMKGLGNDPIRLVLAGATLSGLLLAMTSLLMLVDQRAADEIRFWVTGSIAGRQWSQLTTALPSLLLAGAMVVAVAQPLASLTLGERVAAGLGNHPGRIRLLVVLAVALLVGGATALAGPLVFVGLVVPFLARALAGADIRKTLWLCLPLGPSVVLLADTVSRLLAAPAELPLGVVTALIGAPVLLAIVRARRMPTL